MHTTFTLRQLEYVVAVARHLNFREAAKSCHVSQPALSAQVAQLETVLQARLFERGSRGVIVTPFGETFLPEAEQVLAKALRLGELAKAEQGPLSGEIRIGVIPTIAPYLLPRAMPTLREAHPEARVYLVEGQTDVLVDRLQDGALDCLLLALEADLGSLDQLPVFEDPFLLAVPQGHPLALEEAVALSQVPHPELLLLEEGHCLSRQIEDVCALARESEAGDFRASSLGTLLQMVAMGMGVTLIPSIAADSEQVRTPDITVLPLREPAFRTIGLAWRAGSPRRAEFEHLGRLLEDAAPAT